jgi:hypothetical protein
VLGAPKTARQTVAFASEDCGRKVCDFVGQSVMGLAWGGAVDFVADLEKTELVEAAAVVAQIFEDAWSEGSAQETLF